MMCIMLQCIRPVMIRNVLIQILGRASDDLIMISDEVVR